MGLDKLKDRQIADNIRRYEAASLTEGGPYTLAQLKLEQMRRKPSPFPHIDVARKIIEQARSSSDGQTTYLEIWKAFRPGEEWVGNASATMVGNSLARVIEYCVRHGLPLLSVLVVQSASRRLDVKAVSNIYEDAKKLGVQVGPDPAAFIASETAKALALIASELPEDKIFDA